MYRLIERLPQHSHYQLALQDDDELMRDVHPEQVKARKPSLRSWSADAELRATLYDVAGLIQTVIIAVNTPKGKQAPTFKPVPRPETAADRAERRRQREMYADIARMFMGEQSGG